LPRVLLAVQAACVLLAGALLVLPLPADIVERQYATRAYPALQASLTSWSNTTRYALFDVLILVTGAAVVIAWARVVRDMWRRRTIRPLGRAAWWTLVVTSVAYLWFAMAWGLNYARAPIERAVAADRTRATPAALRALVERATLETNRTYAEAHRTGFPEIDDVPPALVTALHAVEQRLGRPRPTVPGRPKQTLLAPFFRVSGVDGMHAPFLLETLLNHDLTPPERPAVLAHECAHLSGYAPEADASFVGLLAGLRADAPAQYSAWLAIFDHSVSQLPRGEQQVFVNRLEDGPRHDRRAIAARLQSRIDLVAQVSWQTYDQYLKAQGVADGVESYSRVVELLLASGALEWR
jgi:hypothetical protein